MVVASCSIEKRLASLWPDRNALSVASFEPTFPSLHRTHGSSKSVPVITESTLVSGHCHQRERMNTWFICSHSSWSACCETSAEPYATVTVSAEGECLIYEMIDRDARSSLSINRSKQDYIRPLQHHPPRLARSVEATKAQRNVRAFGGASIRGPRADTRLPSYAVPSTCPKQTFVARQSLPESQ